MGWGLCTVAGVAGKGETLDIVPRFLITGRRVAGSSFGGVKGREQVPQFVERYLAGDIDVDAVPLPPHHARRGQQGLRADGGPGRHPQRDLRSHDRPRQALRRRRRGEPRVLRGGARAARLPGDAGVRDGGRHGQGPPGLLAGARQGEPTTRCHVSVPRRVGAARSSASTRRRWPPAAPTTASPASGPSTTRTTTARSPSTPTATTPRPSTTERCSPKAPAVCSFGASIATTRRPWPGERWKRGMPAMIRSMSSRSSTSLRSSAPASSSSFSRCSMISRTARAHRLVGEVLLLLVAQLARAVGDRAALGGHLARGDRGAHRVLVDHRARDLGDALRGRRTAPVVIAPNTISSAARPPSSTVM